MFIWWTSICCVVLGSIIARGVEGNSLEPAPSLASLGLDFSEGAISHMLATRLETLTDRRGVLPCAASLFNEPQLQVKWQASGQAFDISICRQEGTNNLSLAVAVDWEVLEAVPEPFRQPLFLKIFEFSSNFPERRQLVEEPTLSFVLTDQEKTRVSGEYQLKYPEDIDLQPVPVPKMGGYFDGDDYAYVDNIAGLTQDPQSVGFWVRIDPGTTGIIYAVESWATKVVVIEVVANSQIQFVIATSSDDSKSTQVDIPTGAWSKVGFNLYSNAEEGVVVDFDIDHVPTKLVLETTEYYGSSFDTLKMTIGYETGGFQGFLLRIDSYYGTLLDMTDTTVHCIDPECLIDIMDCDLGWAENSEGVCEVCGQCESCDCTEYCARPTNCIQSADDLCDVPIGMYECSECASNSSVNDNGICQCNSNAEPDETLLECRCSDGFTEEEGRCQAICLDLCSTCDEDDGSACTQCVENASPVTGTFPSECECDENYYKVGSTCELWVDPDAVFRFDINSHTFTSSGYTLTDASESGNPAARMGYYFTSETSLSLSPSVEGHTIESAEMWVFLENRLSESSFLTQISEGSTLVVLKLNQDEDLELAAALENSPVVVTTSIDDGKWVKIGYSIEQIDDEVLVSLLLNGELKSSSKTVDTFPSSAVSDYYIGKTSSSSSFEGFMLDFKISWNFILRSAELKSDLCVNYPHCDLLPGVCEYGEHFSEDLLCEECDCGGLSCFRSSDCEMQIDLLCDVPNTMYTCSACKQLSEEVNGICQCVDNASLMADGSECMCDSGHFVMDNQCGMCGNYFKPEEIMVEMPEITTDSNTPKFIVFVSEELAEYTSDCAEIFEPGTYEALGWEPLCVWEDENLLLVWLGAFYDAQATTYALNPEAFTKKALSEDCGSSAVPLEYPISFTGDLTPIVSLTGPSLYNLRCERTDLVLSAAQTYGRFLNPLSILWSVDNSVLSTYLEQEVLETAIIPADMLSEGNYTFTVQVLNVFGEFGEVQHMVEVVNSTTVELQIEPNQLVEARVNSAAYFEAYMTGDCFSGSPQSTWSYLADLNSDDVYEFAPVEDSVLYVPPNSFKPEDMIEFQVYMSAGEYSGKNAAVLYVHKSEIQIKLNSISGYMGTLNDFYLDASESYDPEGGDLTFTWECEDTFGDPCKSLHGDTLVTDKNSAQLIIPYYDIAPNSIYHFIVRATSSLDKVTEFRTMFQVHGGAISTYEQPLTILKDPANRVRLRIISDSDEPVQWEQVQGPTVSYLSSTDWVAVTLPRDSLSPEHTYEFHATQQAIVYEFTLTVYQPPICMDQLYVTQVNDQYLFQVNSCSDRQDSTLKLTYSFGVYLGEEIYSLYGPTSRNYVYLQIPNGFYEAFVQICSDSVLCTIYKTELMQFETNIEKLEESALVEQIQNRIADSRLVPSLVFFYSESYILQTDSWSMLLNGLRESHLYTQYTQSFASPYDYALTWLLQSSVSDAEAVLNSLLANLEESNKNWSQVAVQKYMEAFDNSAYFLLEENQIASKTLRVLRELGSRLAEGMYPNEDPLQLSSTHYSLYVERLPASEMPTSTALIGETEVQMPLADEFSADDIVDMVAVLATGGTSSVYLDVSFYNVGKMSELQSLSPTLVHTKNMPTPLKVRTRVYKQSDSWECVYLDGNTWSTQGCSITNCNDNLCEFEATHTSLFKIREKPEVTESETDCTTVPAIILMCLAVAFAVNLIIVYLACKPKAQPNTDPHTISKYAKKEMEPAQNVAMQIPTDELEPGAHQNSGKSIWVEFKRHHLLLRPCQMSVFSPGESMMLLFLDILLGFDIVFVIGIFSNTLSMQIEYVLVGMLTGAITAFIITLAAFVLVCVTKKCRVTVLGLLLMLVLLIGLGGVVFECFESGEAFAVTWIFVLLTDVLFLQTAIALLRGTFTK